MSPPAASVVLTQSYRAKDQKGGTLIAEGVTDNATHRRKMADLDAYRPSECPTCQHPTMHMHDRRTRLRRDDPESPIEEFPRYRCAYSGCRAIWMVLAGFMARHLHRAWSVVQEAMAREGVVEPVSGAKALPPVAERTRQRWRRRLLSSAVVLMQALSDSAVAGTGTLGALAGSSTRAELVDGLAACGAIVARHKLAQLAGWVHRVVPGLRVT
jgi:hypothetical protein